MLPRAPIPDQLLGQTLAGKYRLVEAHAHGCFGTVFKAQQFFCRQFVRLVAVKVSHQTSLTDDNAAYLFRDALILAQLLAAGDHDGRRHLVPIHDMGLLPEHDGRAFLVMDYIEGHPLLAHMRAAGRMNVATGLRHVREICQALALVHRQGAVHRDLKPDNVLVDRRGVVRLVDFGLADYADPDLGFAPGSFGTYTYMAPETLFGRSTPAADVYGLGLLMYELFTGGGPHLTAAWSDRREPCDHLRIKESLRFPPPSEVQNEIRNDYRWLDRLILRCVETDPLRRFADAAELLEALDGCAAGGELPSQPEPASTNEPATLESERPAPPPVPTAEVHREVRRLLARGAHAQAIDRIDIYRPPEWAVLDSQGARVLRLLGQAYLGLGNSSEARDCLELLRAAHRQKPLLTFQEQAAVLTHLIRCYQGMGLAELANACREEAKRLVRDEER